MTTLKSILETLDGPVVMGGRKAAEERERREKMLARLREANKVNQRYLVICLGMLVALFVGSMWGVLAHLDSPTTVRVVSTGVGATAAIVVWRTIALWREVSAMNLLLALVEDFDDKVVSQLIDILKARLMAPKPKGKPARAEGGHG